MKHLYVAAMYLKHLDVIKKFIADEALPIEIEISTCVIELQLYTWVPERQLELRQMFLRLDVELEKMENKMRRFEDFH